MNPMLWHKVAAISGVAALGLGTYGAHGFRPQNPSYKDVWQTASLYHLVHTAALVAAPITKNPNVFGGLLTTGILAFSGTVMTETACDPFILPFWKNQGPIASVKLEFGVGYKALGSTKQLTIILLTRCYTVAYLEDRKYSTLAPFGGFAFIAAWASLIF